MANTIIELIWNNCRWEID